MTVRRGMGAGPEGGSARAFERGSGLLAVFEDLEQQAAGLALAERDDTVAELAEAEYAEVDLDSRLHASLTAPLTVWLQGELRVSGRLARVGRDFAVLTDSGCDWLLRPAAITRVSGLSARAVAEPARSVLARLTLRAMLRRLPVEGAIPQLFLVDGAQMAGPISRVGFDFLECDGPDERRMAIPFGAIAAIRVEQ